MRAAIIETHLRGLENLPRTPEGLKSLIGRLAGDMGFPPFAEEEMNRLCGLFCKTPNKPLRATKNKKQGNEPDGEILKGFNGSLTPL